MLLKQLPKLFFALFLGILGLAMLQAWLKLYHGTLDRTFGEEETKTAKFQIWHAIFLTSLIVLLMWCCSDWLNPKHFNLPGAS